MIIDCISDLNGHYPKLEGGDLLIVAGDLTSNDQPPAWGDFFEWLDPLCNLYKRIIIIGGNHDNALTYGLNPCNLNKNINYLCDSGTEFVLYPQLEMMEEGKVYERPKLKIWGSPWTLKFEGMNPHCMAFTVDTEEELAEKWKLIPDDTDILVTHSPPYGILDGLVRDNDVWESGSFSLRQKVLSMRNLKVHVFGHIHEHGGIAYKHFRSSYSTVANDCTYVNASHVNERYEPINKPIRIEL